MIGVLTGYSLFLVAVASTGVTAVNWKAEGQARQTQDVHRHVERENINELEGHFKEPVRQRRNSGALADSVPDCRDNKNYTAYCRTYRQVGFCETYPYGMMKHCALTCGFCQCKAKIDIGFLVDSSTSIEKSGKGNFQKCLDFIVNAANSSVISERYAHIGVVLYSSKMRMLFDFNKYYNSSQILQAIGNATYLKGGTRTGKALDFTRTELFEKSARKDVPHVLIVMTDGRSSDSVDAAAAKLHNMNVSVFAIGIGRKYDIKQLETIASKPGSKYVLTTDFDRLNSVYSDIRDEACRVKSTAVDNSTRDHEQAHAQSAMVADGSFDPLSYHVKRPAINVVRSDIPKPDELDVYKPYIPY